MLITAAPADWSPADSIRHLYAASIVISTGWNLGPLGLIVEYDGNLGWTGPDPRYNLSKPFGLSRRETAPCSSASPASRPSG